VRLRLILSFAVIVLITAASVVGIAAITTGRQVRNFIERGGFSGNEQLVIRLENFHRHQHNWVGVEQIFATQHHGPGGNPGSGGPANQLPMEHLRLADAQGKVIFDNGNPPGGLGILLTAEEVRRAIPLREDGQIIGYLLPNIPVPILPSVELALLSLLNRSAMLAALIAGALALALALALAYVLLHPVRELTNAAAELGRGDLSQRVTPRGNDEIATLARTFNHMAASLEEAEQRRRALTADIAHELRNPLAVQRANLEALTDGIYPLTLESLDPVIQQTRLLERLVDDLRTLALADAGQLSLHRAATDFAALLRRRVNALEPEAAARSIEISTSLDETCPPLSLDEERISQIIGNLMSNALRHTPEGGRVSLKLTCPPGYARLTVRDTGSGIPPADLPHLFERFFRGDRARERSGGNTGLGLPIARRLAEAHGGTLDAANHPEGGAVFTLTLPA
jgi:signal transduction histidine kinase